MPKPLHLLRLFLIALPALGLMSRLHAQTYPVPQPLPYSQNFGLNSFSTLPAGFASFTRSNTITTQALAEAATPLANATVTALTTTPLTASTQQGTYGYSPNNTNGQILIQTERSGNANAQNAVVLGLNTSGWINVNLAFRILPSNGGANSGVVYQYRVGTTGAWTNLVGTGNPITGTAPSLPYDLSFVLPAACNNQPAVYIRWSPWNGETSNNSNLRFRFTLDNFSVTGTALPPQPGGIYGANLWLKGNTGTTPTNGFLTSWVDQTGTNTFSVTGTPITGQSPINFNNAVAFSGNASYLTGNTDIKFQTMYAVIKRDNTVFESTVISATLPNNNNVGYMMKGDKMATGNNLLQPNTLYFQSAGNLGAEKPRLGFLEIVNDQGANFSLTNIDGSSYPSVYFSGPGSQMKTFTATPYIGRSQNIADPGYFSGKIAEIVMYPASHTATERLRIQSYLAVKYGITLDPSVGNYLNASGVSIWSNTAYWNDVFGIGRDDASTLLQTQSNSVNTGSGDGTGQAGKLNIQILNGIFQGNNDFLMIGNDAKPLSTEFVTLPASLYGKQRITRNWRTKISGTGPSQVSLVFDLTGIPVAGTKASDFKLLIDPTPDENYSDAFAIDATGFAGNLVAFTGINFSNWAEVNFTLITGNLVNPGGISGSNLWLKGNQGASPASGTLTGWVDQAGNNSFTVSGNPQTGSSPINFNNSVAFDGSGDWLTGNTNITFQTLYAVIKRDNTDFTSTVLSATLPSNENIGYMMKGDRMATGNNLARPNELYFQSVESLGAEKPRLGALEIVNDQGANLSKSYIDGSFNFTEYFSGVGTQMKTFSAIPYIGRSQNTADPGYFTGKIAELVMYPASHTSDNRLRVESYLAIKYGITLDPILGTYRSASNTSIWSNTTYWNDVFGIGRDDSSGLNQTQSNSVNTGSGNGIGQSGKANITVSTTGSLTNGQYLVIGNDAGPLTDNMNNLYTNFALLGGTRLVRQWKVANTGGAGTVNLVFDTSGLTLTGKLGSSITDYYLSIDLDGDGNFQTGTHQAVAAGAFTANGVSFQNVSLPNNAVFTIVLILQNQLNKWTGAIDSAWSKSGNWSLGRIPVTTDSVVIDKTSYARFPVLDRQFTVSYRMNFFNKPQFAIAPGGMLSIAAGAIANMASPDKFIISNGNGSGLIGPINGLMLGNDPDSWTIERWFGARRSFRYIGSPVTPSNSPLNYIRQLWMAGDALGDAWNYPYSLGSPQYKTSGFGTHITGGTKANGFDQNQTGNPSLWTWNPVSQTWAAQNQTTDILASLGDAYRLVVRGDRGTNLDMNRPVPSETKIWFVGTLLNDSYNVPAAKMAANAGEYSFIANPYQSVVDASLITKNGVTNFYYLWDANVVGTAGFGAFVTVDIANNSASMKPGAVGASQANKFIQPGQAVFFQNTATAPHSITFTQSSKATPGDQTQIFGVEDNGIQADQILWMTLSALSEEMQTNNVIDGSVIRFNSSYTTLADYEDGNKFNNPDETIGVMNNGKFISIDKRNLPVDGEIIPLKIIRYRTSKYTMQLDASEMVLNGMDAYLKDNYLQTESLIIPGKANDFAFVVTAGDAASAAEDRFSIVFRTAAALPVKYTKVDATLRGSVIDVNWEVAGDHQGASYDVERSSNGQQFSLVHSIRSKATSTDAQTSYSWTDTNPFAGNNYYRIKGTDRLGVVSFSNIALVKRGSTNGGMEVYPNPVITGSIQVSLNDLPAGKYQYSLVSASGQQMQSGTIEHNGGSASRQINLLSRFAAGSYQLILNGNDKRFYHSLIIK